MLFSRRNKARVIAALNPRRLMWVTLALGVAILAWHIMAVMALLFDVNLATGLAGGFVFIALLPVHAFRWAAIRRGWSAVHTGDLNLLASIFSDPDREEGALPLALQAHLAEGIQRKGWLSWAEVMNMAREAGIEARIDDWHFLLGGCLTPVARRTDWRRYMDDKAWASGRMAKKFDRHTSVTAMPRARL